MIGLYGQTVIDVSIQEYNSIEYIGDLVQANNISLTEDLTGIDLIIPDIVPVKSKAYPIVIKQNEAETTIVISQQGQTLLDIAIQEYGSIEYVKNVIQDNNVKLNEDLVNKALDINSFDVGNDTVKGYVISNKIKINNKFDSTVEIINFVFEDNSNAVFEDDSNEILE